MFAYTSAGVYKGDGGRLDFKAEGTKAKRSGKKKINTGSQSSRETRTEPGQPRVLHLEEMLRIDVTKRLDLPINVKVKGEETF